MAGNPSIILATSLYLHHKKISKICSKKHSAITGHLLPSFHSQENCPLYLTWSYGETDDEQYDATDTSVWHPQHLIFQQQWYCHQEASKAGNPVTSNH